MDGPHSYRASVPPWFIRIQSVRGIVHRFAAHFERHYSYQVPALYGTLSFNASVVPERDCDRNGAVPGGGRRIPCRSRARR